MEKELDVLLRCSSKTSLFLNTSFKPVQDALIRECLAKWWRKTAPLFLLLPAPNLEFEILDEISDGVVEPRFQDQRRAWKGRENQSLSVPDTTNSTAVKQLEQISAAHTRFRAIIKPRPENLSWSWKIHMGSCKLSTSTVMTVINTIFRNYPPPGRNWSFRFPDSRVVIWENLCLKWELNETNF